MTDTPAEEAAEAEALHIILPAEEVMAAEEGASKIYGISAYDKNV